MEKNRLILSNQVTGYLFLDVVNAFADQYDCTLYVGQVDEMKAKLKPSVKKKMLIRYDRNKAVNRIYTWGMFTLRFFFRVLFSKKSTDLFIVTNPPFTPFVGYLFNRLRGTKYHLLIYDIYPDALVNFGMIKKGSLPDRIWSKWNRKLFQRASTIYSLSENMAALIRQYNPDVKVEVIHNWTDTGHIIPLPKKDNPFAKQHGQLDKITVMYSGNMGATHAVERIADIAAALKNDTSFGFMLIGDGAKKEMIEQRKEKQALDNLIILPYQEPDTLPYSLTTADVGIVTLSAGAEDLSVPSKTYNMLAAGAALLVIASPSSELANLIRHYDCGEQFEEHETDRMVAFIRSLKNDAEKLQRLKENARTASYDFTPANAELYPQLLNSNAHVS